MGVPLWFFVWTQHTPLSPVPRVSPLAGPGGANAPLGPLLHSLRPACDHSPLLSAGFHPPAACALAGPCHPV